MKFILLESIITGVEKRGVYHNIYKNPSPAELNSKEDSMSNRAILDADGNMYMEAAWDREGDAEKHNVFSELIHNDLLNALHEKGILKEITVPAWYSNIEMMEYAIFVQRRADSRNFYLAESYDPGPVYEVEKIKAMYEKVSKKMPHCKFFVEQIFLN